MKTLDIWVCINMRCELAGIPVPSLRCVECHALTRSRPVPAPRPPEHAHDQ
jgi:hypothetical protein